MTNEQKLREIEEGTPEIKRSELWNKIYSIVRQIPRENVNCDAMDASSASSEIERMVTSLISEGYYPKEFTNWIGDNGIEKGHNDDEDVWILYEYNSMNVKKEFTTLDELFNYWRENEQ